MSLRFLPTPIFLILMVFCMISFLSFLVKIRHSERKILVFGGFLIMLSSINIIIHRVITEYIIQFNKYISINMMILAVLQITGISLMMIGTWKKVQNNPVKKKQFVMGLSLSGICILLIGVIWVIFSAD